MVIFYLCFIADLEAIADLVSKSDQIISPGSNINTWEYGQEVSGH